MNTIEQLKQAANTVRTYKGADQVELFLLQQLAAAVEQLPRTRRAQFVSAVHQAACQGVTVQVRSIMSGELVTIPLERRGTCSDPSQERYWSA